jgi:hypothetical protein
MAACRRCGSLRTQIIHGSTLDRVLTRVLRQRVLFCGRCGWRGRARTVAHGESSDRRIHREAIRDKEMVREPVADFDLDAFDRALGATPVRPSL